MSSSHQKCSEANEKMQTNKQTFDKRPGTTHKGDKYEDLLTALIAFHLVQNDQVEDFKLSSNVKKFGKLDDVVVEISYKNSNKPAKYAIQVKHKDSERRRVSKEMLLGEKGDFSIQQYYKTFKQCKLNDYNLIIYTNASASDLSNVDLHLHTICQVPLAENFLDPSSSGNVYKFNKISHCGVNSKETKEHVQFFEKFFLYTNQNKLEKMKSTALASFKEAYSCREDSFNMYLDFISNWSEREGRKSCLDKQTIKLKIAEILLKPLMKNSAGTHEDNPKFLLFQEIVLQYDIILVETDGCLRWNEIFGRNCEINIQEINRKFCIVSTEIESSGQIEDEQKTIALWHMNKIPLVIQLTEESKKAIEMCQEEGGAKRKFVLVAEKINREVFKNAKIFQNLRDVDSNSDLYKNIVQHNISLQGRQPIPLQELIEDNEEMREAITTDELIKIMDGSFRIGEAKEDLPDPYIDQFVSTILVDYNIINNPRVVGLFVISCNKKMDLLRSKIRGVTLSPIDQFLKEDWKDSERLVIAAEEKCTTQQFEAICRKTNGICHHFRINSAGNLEWVSTKGKIDQLQPYLLPPHFVQESEVLKSVDNKINLICALPGMGKSIMLKYFKNNFSSKFWIIDISFKEIFTENIQQPKNVLDLHRKKYSYSPFEAKVMDIFVKEKRVVFLWDGLDELPNNFIQPAIEAIENLTYIRGFTCWITARDPFGDLLKNKFDAFPMTIKHLEKGQQNTYIRKYLSSNHSEGEIEEIVQKITNVIAISTNIDLLGIPLQIKILSELFYRNTDKYFRLIGHTFTLADMIHYFIKEKFKVCFEDRGKCDTNNHFFKNIIKEMRNFKVLQYEIIALKMYLPKHIFDALQITELTPLIRDEFGIITQIDHGNNTATFLHNIYGEYFVATWLVRNFAKVPDLSKFFFEDKFKNVRMIFDMRAAKNCPAHLAVLYKNFDVLQISPVDQKDELGRNPLHLACSLGQKHPLLTVEVREEKYIIDFLKGGLVKQDNEDYKKIINLLEEKCDPFEKDQLFNWNSISYAEHTLTLFPIEIFLKKHKIELRVLDVATLIFYAVKFNYLNLFESIENVPYVENNYYDLNLLHHVVKYQRSEFLDKVFRTEEYCKVIDKPFRMEKPLLHMQTSNNEKMSFSTTISAAPLHIASRFGDNETVKILIEHKTNMNIVNIHGHSALHWASEGGHIETVKLLRRNGGVLNHLDNNGLNELHAAVFSGSLELVNYLLANGSSICMDKSEITPLDVAVDINRVDLLEVLIKKGTPRDEMQNFITSSWKNAVCRGKEDLIECFIKNGANIHDAIEADLSALHRAAQSGNIAAIKTLIKHGANVNVFDKFGRTPLHFASLQGTVEIVEILLQNGADVNATDFDGLDALSCSVIGRHEKISKYLIENKIDIKNSNSLMWAICFESTEFIQVLIEKGANVKKRYNQGQGATPLHGAAFLNRRDVLDLLMSHGANEHKKDNNGITPRNILRWQKQGTLLEHYQNTKLNLPEVTVNIGINLPLLTLMDVINSIY